MNPIRYIIEKIDENNFNFLKKYVFLFLIFLVGTLSLGYVVYYFSKRKIIHNISLLEKKKQDIEALVIKKKEILAKKSYIDAILAEKDSFRVKDFVYSVLQKYNFAKNIVSSNESISQQKIKNDYLELQMTVEIENISTSEVLNILAIIENDVRVYIKNIGIKNVNNKLHLSLTVATIQLISS